MNFQIFTLAVISYFTGAIPFALIVSRIKGVDLRKTGSGNIGATNVYRALGFKYAVLVFLLDLIKGYIPVLSALNISAEPLFHIGIGIIAILGHSLTVFAGFKGGKGAATGIGVLFALSPLTGFILVIAAAFIIWAFRYVSLATIICALLAPLLFYISNYPLEYVVLVAVAAVFIIIRHKDNIVRLVKREENKI
ncbi:MAG: glycerol-3-phosphate 1-O-acyltransferase PlsY [bacterium]|nr:glycerol-3-phosphate 1-O-acyltransferase PlsY [bacterium]